MSGKLGPSTSAAVPTSPSGKEEARWEAPTPDTPLLADSEAAGEWPESDAELDSSSLSDWVEMDRGEWDEEWALMEQILGSELEVDSEEIEQMLREEVATGETSASLESDAESPLSLETLGLAELSGRSTTATRRRRTVARRPRSLFSGGRTAAAATPSWASERLRTPESSLAALTTPTESVAQTVRRLVRRLSEVSESTIGSEVPETPLSVTRSWRAPRVSPAKTPRRRRPSRRIDDGGGATEAAPKRVTPAPPPTTTVTSRADWERDLARIARQLETSLLDDDLLPSAAPMGMTGGPRPLPRLRVFGAADVHASPQSSSSSSSSSFVDVDSHPPTVANDPPSARALLSDARIVDALTRRYLSEESIARILESLDADPLLKKSALMNPQVARLTERLPTATAAA
ncbi:hypothetical protein CDCA_CDCA13G3601 [Cyanidium caldarium]|uniref:Uncharacterized protein n=1 Tax=Cyanidium caldarium TaxID=2771 RepID=A0AAV9IZM0_CYACA|nr:hypothetical protein CDCA_CDCA13G3601 [Cyanidium caldarium]|eukprot:ctg_2109.g547